MQSARPPATFRRTRSTSFRAAGSRSWGGLSSHVQIFQAQRFCTRVRVANRSRIGTSWFFFCSGAKAWRHPCYSATDLQLFESVVPPTDVAVGISTIIYSDRGHGNTLMAGISGGYSASKSVVAVLGTISHDFEEYTCIYLLSQEVTLVGVKSSSVSTKSLWPLFEPARRASSGWRHCSGLSRLTFCSQCISLAQLGEATQCKSEAAFELPNWQV